MCVCMCVRVGVCVGAWCVCGCLVCVHVCMPLVITHTLSTNDTRGVTEVNLVLSSTVLFPTDSRRKGY